LFSSRGWTVQPNEEGGHDVIDRDGNAYDWAETSQDAIKLCQKHSAEAYEEALLSAVQEFEMSELDVTTLEAVARLLGIRLDTL
jgi:phosphoenolpyruvate carboxylase